MTFADLRDAIMDGKTFVASCRYFAENVSVSMIVGAITALFSVIAGFDYINGDHYGYGKKYYAAWEAMAPMASSMVGITVLVPVLRLFLTPIISPIFEGLQTHPAMFAGVLLDPSMGGMPMSIKMAPENYGVAMYSSVVLGTMLGCTIVFNIPVGLSMIREENHIFFAFGTLIGLVSIPIGCIIGGFLMETTSFPLTVAEVFKNMIAVIIIAVLIGVPLYLKPFPTLKAFMHFSGAITFLMTFGALIAIFQQYAFVQFPLWSKMLDDEGENSFVTILGVVPAVASVLTGTIPMMHFITTMIGPGLQKLSQKIGLTAIDAGGLIACLATAVPMYGMFDDMSKKGMVFAAAFEVGAAYAIGDHLAYIGALEPEMIVPMLVAKLLAGVVALVMSVFSADMFVRKGDEAIEMLKQKGGGKDASKDKESGSGEHSETPATPPHEV
jgi:ethanolamine transporter